MTRAAAVAVAVAMLFFQSLGSAQVVRPLPDPKPFFDAVRQNLARSEDVQKLYAYKERRTDLNLNPFGRLGTGGTRVISSNSGSGWSGHPPVARTRRSARREQSYRATRVPYAQRAADGR